MKYKKIYIEITNICNLACPFCIQNTRPKQFMTKETFEEIIKKVKPYTNYLYFHILGEPCMHPNINEFIYKASKDFYINITTNGYKIEKLENNVPIRQLNISLHSYHPKYNISIEDYITSILNKIKELPNTYISLRFWVDNPYINEILFYINKYYNKNITKEQIKQNSCLKLQEKVFINPSNTFTWPDLESNYYEEIGTCYGLIDQLGILVDGTVVPCCLDTKGNIPLGNILTNSLNEIENTSKYQNILNGFKQNKKIEELCKHCNFVQNRKN